ncbi:MAG: hypothetical protein PWQ62_1113 [Candidatus Methanomethylophilaceae archaeon]|nr:hypothetical protein [Candidatus Methanomethylophilaceae archaeon]
MDANRKRIRTNIRVLFTANMEDLDSRFRRVSSLIASNDMDSAYLEVERIASISQGDPFVLVKCAALLLTMNRKAQSREIAAMALETVSEDEGDRLQLAIALRNLRMTKESLYLIEGLQKTDAVALERAKTLLAMDLFDEALKILESLEGREALLLKSECLSLSGEHEKAIFLASKLTEGSGSYEEMSLFVANLIRAGKVKEAIKVADRFLKSRKNADSLALKSYVMRINGRLKASMNFANQALSADKRHIGAMWNMAICLIEKGRINEAKVLAGAINEVEPGSHLALEILDLCNA